MGRSFQSYPNIRAGNIFPVEFKGVGYGDKRRHRSVYGIK